MGRTLIIFCHPNHTSLNKSILDSVTDHLMSIHRDYDVIDLYEDKFDPTLTKQALIDYDTPSTDEQIVKYVKLIKKASSLIFIYPLWWYRGPALLEGFLDRVMCKETAFSYKNGYHEPLFTNIEKAFVFTTSAQKTEDLVNMFGNPVQKAFMDGTLHFVGVQQRVWFNLELSETCCDEQFTTHIETIIHALNNYYK